MDYTSSLFPNTTIRIEIVLKYYKKGKSFFFELEFGRYPQYSNISIRCTTENPREHVEGIYRSIIERIKPHYNMNRYLHSPIAWIILIAPIPLNFFTINSFSNNDTIRAAYIIFLQLVCLLSYVFSFRFKPYIEFNTSRQNKINSLLKFFITGIITYLLFGIFAEYVF